MQEWWRDPRCHLGRLGDSSPLLTDRSDLQAAIRFIWERLELEKGARVLDLCCGPGRYAVDLSQRGLDVVGLDINEDYVALARRLAEREGAHAEFLVGDMREIPWVDRFDAVINVGSSFGFFASEAEDQRVLEAVAGALGPGGRLLLEMGNREYLLKNFETHRSRENADGSITEVQRSFDFVRSRIDASFRRSAAGSPPETWSHSWRAYTLAEIARLLSSAGLDLVHTFGDWEAEPYDVDASRMVVIARKRLSVRSRAVGPTEHALVRDLRLAALREAPDSFAESADEAAAKPESYWIDLIRSDKHVMFVAEVDGEARGSVYGIRDEDDPKLTGIGGMWVASAFRGLGLGSALLEAVIRGAKSEGFRTVRLWVPAHSHQARSLYSRAGFVFTGASRQVHGETPFVATEMLLHLDTRMRST